MFPPPPMLARHTVGSILGACIALAVVSAAAPTTITVDLSRSVGKVDPRELSYTWDMSGLQPERMAHDQPLNLTNERIIALSKMIQPMVLRISGTACEDAIFDNRTDTNVALPAAVQRLLRPGGGGTNVFHAKVTDWDEVAGFAAAVGSPVILGLNHLLRSWPEGGSEGCGSGPCPWDATNARAWIAHNMARNIDVLGYELGNEPGCYMPEVNISATQAAEDFRRLRSVISDVWDGRPNPPLVVGPDVGGCAKAPQFASILAGTPQVDIATFHFYVLGGGKHHPTYTVADIVAAAKANTTVAAVSSYASAWRRYAPKARLWLGEGATTYSQPLMQSFCMLYNVVGILEQTGLAGVSLFAQQALKNLFQGVGDQARPAPLYWFTVLWKRLMGTDVYATTHSPDLLVAARSATETAGGIASLAVANLQNASVHVAVTRGAQAKCDVYLLEAATDPSGLGVDLGGRLLQVTSDPPELPRMVPNTVPCLNVTMAPLSVAFVHLRNV